MKNTEDRRYQEIVSRLRENGFRLTPQRLAVIRVMIRSREHPSVDTVYREVRSNFPTTSLATVYKTISILREMGEVMDLALGEGRQRYDMQVPAPHAHLVCTRCNEIIDTDFPDLSNVSRALETETGYRVEHQRLEFFGVCRRCRQDPAPSTRDGRI